MSVPGRDVLWLRDVRSGDVGLVGGKNASLGEMISGMTDTGIQVPDGFATTSEAYWQFIDGNGLRERIGDQIDRLHAGAPLDEVGATIRAMVLAAEFSGSFAEAVVGAYQQMGERLGRPRLDVAVRSSATAEDLPAASFAGQLETFLNVCGPDELLAACKQCFASLFTDRAIHYREDHGFDHTAIALSVGVQQMVRSDLAGAGVMFTIDTETGFPHTVLINASWGLGELVVKGDVDPDEYLVFKPLLDRRGLRPIIDKRIGAKQHMLVYGEADSTQMRPTDEQQRRDLVLDDDEILTLARWGALIEQHYQRPMDVEWAKDGVSGELYIVQARPETVQVRREAAALRSYRLEASGQRLATGLAIGDAIATGRVCALTGPDQIDRFEDGAVLVTGVTDPDWEPIMKRAAAIVTDHGGRTSHAAIVSRELGVSAVVGCGDATGVLKDGQQVTVSCAEGDQGVVYAGTLPFRQDEIDLGQVPATTAATMLNLADPGAAFRWWRLPADGVGLARMEFIVANHIRVHPMALAHYDALTDETARQKIDELTRGLPDRTEYFVSRLAFGVARLAASQWPRPVIVRLSDFKTNEYARLLGGAQFEPDEPNPMIGWRGASRYYSEGYRDGFVLECRALRRVRDDMGLTNVVVMVPFCRTLGEADRVLDMLARNGLERGRNGLEVYVMAEIPANIVLADEFADRFDGFSIGSNDLTQLTLGVDRDSEALAELFDESDAAVTRSIEYLIEAAHAKSRKVGLCGQRPSNDPAFAGLLVRAGIDSISVAPDSFLQVKQHMAHAERSA